MPGPFLGHALCGLALSLGGSDAQRERWLPRLASGEAIGSIALAETRGWECDDWGAALEAGRLSGEKRFVPHAGLADVLVVGARGGELALVERDATGVEARPVDTFDRTRSLAHLSLRGAPAEPLPGGRALAERVLDAGRILLAADAYGAAWTLIDASVAYVKTREQFDTPLAQFQAVKHRLADMATEAEPQRGLLWYAAHTFDHLPEEAPRSAVMAKAHVTDRAVDIGRQAVELHGGIGFTWECDVQFFVKRTMFDRTWLGTPEVQRERLARLSGWSGGPGGTP